MLRTTGFQLVWVDEEAGLRPANDRSAPPAGMRSGSAQYRVYREEVSSVTIARRKKQQAEKLRKEMLSATPGV